MRRRIFNFASLVSLLLCLATVMLWLRSHGGMDNLWFAMQGNCLYWVVSDHGPDSDDNGMVTLTVVQNWPNYQPPNWVRDCDGYAIVPSMVRRGLAAWAVERGLVIGRYSSGIAMIPLRSDGTACLARDKNGGDLPVEHGFDHLSGPHFWWALEIPHWVLASVFLVLPLIHAGSLAKRMRRVRPHHCTTCDYNLTCNTSGVCPECGTRVVPISGTAAGRAETAIAVAHDETHATP